MPTVLDEPTPWITKAFVAKKGDLKVTNLRDVQASLEVKPEQSAVLKYLYGDGDDSIRLAGDVGPAERMTLIPLWPAIQRKTKIKPTKSKDLPREATHDRHFHQLAVSSNLVAFRIRRPPPTSWPPVHQLAANWLDWWQLGRNRNESPGPFHLHIPQSAAASDTEDGRLKFFDSVLEEKKVIAAGIEAWRRKSNMNTGEVWDCLVGNIAVTKMASRQWGKVVGRILTDMTPQPTRDRYKADDHSVMADVLAYQQVLEFQGDETISILPPAGEVRVPGRKTVKELTDVGGGMPEQSPELGSMVKNPRAACSGRPVDCRWARRGGCGTGR